MTCFLLLLKQIKLLLLKPVCCHFVLNSSNAVPSAAPADHLLAVHKDMMTSRDQTKKLRAQIKSASQAHEQEKKRLLEEVHENLSDEHKLSLEQLR